MILGAGCPTDPSVASDGAIPRPGLLLAPLLAGGEVSESAFAILFGFLLPALLHGWLVVNSVNMLPPDTLAASRKLLVESRPCRSFSCDQGASLIVFDALRDLRPCKSFSWGQGASLIAIDALRDLRPCKSFSWGQGASLIAIDALRDLRLGLLLLVALLVNVGLLSAMLPNEADALVKPNEGLLSGNDGLPSTKSMSEAILSADTEMRALRPGLRKPVTEDLPRDFVSKARVLLLDRLHAGVLSRSWSSPRAAHASASSSLQRFVCLSCSSSTAVNSDSRCCSSRISAHSSRRSACRMASASSRRASSS